MRTAKGETGRVAGTKRKRSGCERFSGRAPWKHDYESARGISREPCRPTALLPADAARLRSLPPAWHNNFSVPHRSRVWWPGDEMRIRTHSHLSPKTLHFSPYFWGMPLQFGMGKMKRACSCQKFQSLQRKQRERGLCRGDYTVTVKWVEGRSKRHPHCLRADCVFEV